MHSRAGSTSATVRYDPRPAINDGPGKAGEWSVRSRLDDARTGLGQAGLGQAGLGQAGPEQAGSGQPAPAPGTPASPRSMRILVADDNADAADSLGLLLELQGNEVRTVHDGLAAVETAATFKPEVVLLDLGMPKLDGYQAARRIREQAASGDVLLIALTGWGQDQDRQRTKEAGFDVHLVKPLDMDLLQRLLASRD
jgi:CheY-like chemotaxis protein